MSINTDKYNVAVKSWGLHGKTMLQQTGKSLGIVHRKNSPSSSESLARIKDRYSQDNAGFINKVSYTSISRGLIYTTYGAGKGIGGGKGSRWIDRYGNRKKTNADSLNKLGSGSRRAKPFIKSVLDGPEGIEKLADIVAEHQGDAIIENLHIK